MQTPTLQNLEGQKVTQAARIHDYVQLAFGSDVGVSIYNDVTLTPDMDLSLLLGHRLELVSQSDMNIELAFSNGLILKIDLHPQAAHGPEVLELNRKGFPSVVWNQV